MSNESATPRLQETYFDPLPKVVTDIQAGEVYYYPLNPGGGYARQRVDIELVGDERSLVPHEVPGWRKDREAMKVAVEALEDLKARLVKSSDAVGADMACNALAEIIGLSSVPG